MFGKKPVWMQPGRENQNGRNHEYDGKRSVEPIPRRTGMAPLQTIRCPDCGGAMRVRVARKQANGYDPYSPNYGRGVFGKRLWCCGNKGCMRVLDCWDGWEPPDMYRHLFKVSFFSTKPGKLLLLMAAVGFVVALARIMLR